MLDANPFQHPAWTAAVAAGAATPLDDLPPPPPTRRNCPVRIAPFARAGTVTDAYGTIHKAHCTRATLREDDIYFARHKTPDDWIFPRDPIWVWRAEIRELMCELGSYYRIQRNPAWLPQIRKLRAEHTRLVGIERAVVASLPVAA